MGKLNGCRPASRLLPGVLGAPRRLFGWLQNTSLRVCLFVLTLLAVLFYIVALAIVLQLTEDFIYSVYAYVDEHEIVFAQLPEDLYRRLQLADFLRIFATYFLALLGIFFEVFEMNGETHAGPARG